MKKKAGMRKSELKAVMVYFLDTRRMFLTEWIPEVYTVNQKNYLKDLGFTQPPPEISTRNIKIIMFLGSKVRRVRRADNLTTIYERIV
jgi:hypothetical protein